MVIGVLLFVSQPMDQHPLKMSDLVVLSCLTQTPLSNPDSMIGDFCINAGVALLIHLIML